MAKLKRGNPNDPKKGGELKEATVTPKDPMYYNNLSSEYMKRGEYMANEGYSDDLRKKRGMADYNRLLEAEKNGYYEVSKSGEKRLSEDKYLFRKDFKDGDYVFDEKEYPEYVKEAVKNGMKIDFAIYGPETAPVYFFKKEKVPMVKAEPKNIEFSAPKMKLKTPIEERILDILNTRSGGGRRVETNYGSRDYNGNLGIKQFAQWVKDNRGKVDEYRANRK
jgi:hypothetical protein